MDDQEIMDLYWSRSENAISETAAKYGSYCYAIAYNILTNNPFFDDTELPILNRLPARKPVFIMEMRDMPFEKAAF